MDLARSQARLSRTSLHIDDMQLLGTLSCLLHIAGNLLRGRALLRKLARGEEYVQAIMSSLAVAEATIGHQVRPSNAMEQ